MERARQASVRDNGFGFHQYEPGEGRLALCLHGFHDSAWTYRYLRPALTAVGFRAVAPFMRGYPSTGAPSDRRYDRYTIAQDDAPLHAALGGGAAWKLDPPRVPRLP
jgi:pimeloyl-ACP methyl ester carboxylesterase